MQKKVTTALTIIVASGSVVYAVNVTWDFSNDVLIGTVNEGNQQRESHITVSVSNNNYLVTALMDNTTTTNFRCRAYNSTDAGNTWTDRGFLSIPGDTNYSNDPVVASTADGKFFIACFAEYSADKDPFL